MTRGACHHLNSMQWVKVVLISTRILFHVKTQGDTGILLQVSTQGDTGILLHVSTQGDTGILLHVSTQGDTGILLHVSTQGDTRSKQADPVTRRTVPVVAVVSSVRHVREQTNHSTVAVTGDGGATPVTQASL
ncbi:hypothetical protein ACOMHN_067202 [Nucella lapillus]